MDELILARIQFAANISFHILFPTITIALGSVSNTHLTLPTTIKPGGYEWGGAV